MKTQIIAHRGFWQSDPPTTENSLQALKNAQNLKCFGSELDVQMTKDGVLVVYHDDDCNGQLIADVNYDAFAKTLLSNGQVIPTLRDYLSQGKQEKSVRLIVELKPSYSENRDHQIVAKALDLVAELEMSKQVDFISFSLAICLEIKRIAPEYKVYYLEGDLSPSEVNAHQLDGLDYHYEVFIKNPTWIAEAKKLGLFTNSWTVNDAEIFKLLQDQGLDFVTTNNPDIIMNLEI